MRDGTGPLVTPVRDHWLADNVSPWYVSGASDPRFDDDVLHELGAITGHDLEVVDTSGLVNEP